MAQSAAIQVAILWHMHQPNYCEPHSNRLALPWVRLHALKDYLDMPLTAAAYENVRVTFNLVPSLLDQLDTYIRGGSDRHMELSRLPVAQMNVKQKLELLETFFMASPAQMILPYPRYRQLYEKVRAGSSSKDTLTSLFSSSEIRDIQVWSNLVWVDPMFRDEEPIRSLFAKDRHFTEEDKREMLSWQLSLMKRVVPTYQKLQHDGRIEVSFTPYYHPILPLVCDTSVATESQPSIRLPRHRFQHPEDARHQIERSQARYRELFGEELKGMWPSEGSVSEDVLQMMTECGISWAATDQEILSHSLDKSGLSQTDHPVHRVYQYGPSLKLVFRDHALSDRIGFVYSTWDTERAVADFVGHLKRLREYYRDRLDSTVVPIILDGENAWEYFPNDATDFLNLLYRTLGTDPQIRTVTVSDAATRLPADRLTRLFAGSWINHNFKIWIGHDEDNAAWDLLTQTREALVKYEAAHPDMSPTVHEKAWEQIYIAEGSDWCWWYGDDHRGEYNEQFDRIYRQHLIAVYELLGLDTPFELLKPIYAGQVSSFTVLPDSLLTPELDGRVTHFYEWAGAGSFDCLRAGGAMHKVDRRVSAIYFAYDRDCVYIRLDFGAKKGLVLTDGLKAVLTFFKPARTVAISLDRQEDRSAGPVRFCLQEVLEVAIERSSLWEAGFGSLSFSVSLMQGDQRLESWPENEPIELEVPERDQELFWPV